MECQYRILEINVISANDLKDVSLFAKMDVYAVVSISGGDPRGGVQKFKTNVDRQGGNNPSWNFPVKFRIDDTAVKQNRPTLTFTIRCDRALGDKDVGMVIVPVKELYDGVSADAGKSTSTSTQMQSITYQVRKPSGKPKGELHFSYKFGEIEKSAYADAAVAAAVPVAYPGGTSAGYPPPPPPVSAGYPPPPPAYVYPAQPYAQYGYGGYPPPPPTGYVYPPAPPPEYGYPQQQPQNRNKFGLGLGAGLLGGAVGGLLIGDLVSDAGAYDAGYDAGSGDAGGF